MTFLLRVDSLIRPHAPTVTAHVPDTGLKPVAASTACFVFSLVVKPQPGNGVLFGDQCSLTHVGKVPTHSGRKSATAGRTVRALDLESIGEPVSVARVLSLTTGAARAEIDALIQNGGGALSQGATAALIEMLRAARPDASTVLDWLETLGDERRFVEGRAGARWEMDRDKLGVAQRIFGASTTQHWRRPEDEDAPYLSGLFSLRPDPVEADAINHDATVVQAFTRVGTTIPGSRQDVKVFRSEAKDPNTGEYRFLHTLNINASGLETTTGGDLLYYHVNTESCVVVQYKRLTRRGDTYSVDKRLRGQMDRMAIVNEASKEPTTLDDWRLGTDSCYVKLVEPHGRVDPSDTGMIDGRYIPLSYLELLNKLIFMRDNGQPSRIELKSVRHLTNTLFIGLVREGWVGTCGVTVTDLVQYCKDRLKERESLMIAVDHSTETPSERIARSRRRGSK